MSTSLDVLRRLLAWFVGSGLDRLALAEPAPVTTPARPHPDQIRRHRMHLNLDVHHQYALDRQQRLRNEAAAHRLADREPTRTRVARFLRGAADCPEAPTAASGGVGKPLTQRG